MATAPKPVSRSAAKGAPSAENQSDAPPPKKSKKKLFLILILLIVLLGAGGGGAWYYFNVWNHNAGEKKAEKPSAPIFVPLEAFTVNLQPENGDHYLQAAITLQVTSKEDIDLFKLYTPQVRNRILLLLSSKKASEISSVDGKKKLAEEIVATVNQPFSEGGKPQSATSVLFTSFIIQ